MEAFSSQNNKLAAKRQKNRLTGKQLRLLENSFFQTKKLGPMGRHYLADKLGMPAKQVAIWYQNRRARWKNQNIELEYRTLQLRMDSVVDENTRLHREIRQLKNEQNKREVLNICEPPLYSHKEEYALNFGLPSASSVLVSCEEEVRLNFEAPPLSSLSSSCDGDGGWDFPVDHMNNNWQNTVGFQEEEFFARLIEPEEQTTYMNSNYSLFSP